MKYLKLIFVFLSFFAITFGQNKNPLYIADLVNVDEWDDATMIVLIETLHLDSILSNYWRNENPPMLSINHKTISNFKEEIQSFLFFRKKILSILNNESLLLLKEPFYIIEDQGYTHSGFTQTFTIILNDNQRYYYKYNPNKDCFIKEEIEDTHIDANQQPFYHSLIEEMGIMTGMHIVTAIHIGSKNRISYQILEVVVW